VGQKNADFLLAVSSTSKSIKKVQFYWQNLMGHNFDSR
jgi:hypothetical protein